MDGSICAHFRVPGGLDRGARSLPSVDTTRDKVQKTEAYTAQDLFYLFCFHRARKHGDGDRDSLNPDTIGSA